MASKDELYAGIVNGETQKVRDEISVQGGQLSDRRSREIESASTPKEGAAIATAALNEMVKELSEILQLHSAPGEGTRVVITIPLAKELA